MPELEYIPDPPTVFVLSDELVMNLSILTGFSGHDQRLLRCDDNGALFVTDPWSQMRVVETDELYIFNGASDIVANLAENKGILIANGVLLIEVDFQRVPSGALERIHVPPNNYLWYPHGCTAVTVNDLSDTVVSGYVGVTAFI